MFLDDWFDTLSKEQQFEVRKEYAHMLAEKGYKTRAHDLMCVALKQYK